MKKLLSVQVLSIILAAGLGVPVTGLAGCPYDEAAAGDELHVTGLIHFNINVSDFERSRAFYRAAGFADEIGDFPETNTLAVSQGVGLDAPYRLRAELIYLGQLPDAPIDLTEPTGRFIDMVEWLDPFRSDPPYARVDHLGITYFSMRVDDVAATTEALLAAGGSVAAAPAGGDAAMLRDPDGTYLQLRQALAEEPAIDYLNLNVRDLDCSRQFYAMLGLAPAEDSAQEPGPGALYSELGLAADTPTAASMLRHRVDGSRLKLNQWQVMQPAEGPYPPPINHLGLHRINWATTDLAGDVATLRERGVEFLSDIVPCCEGDASTFGFIIFEDPDGIYNQLMGRLRQAP